MSVWLDTKQELVCFAQLYDFQSAFMGFGLLADDIYLASRRVVSVMNK